MTAPGASATADENRVGADRVGADAVSADRVSITACPNGPLLVRGDFEILTPSGDVIPPRRKTVALCRCGVSSLKPFCDGSHKAVDFRTEHEPPAPQQQFSE